MINPQFNKAELLNRTILQSVYACLLGWELSATFRDGPPLRPGELFLSGHASERAHPP
jgi:hypothetical protein